MIRSQRTQAAALKKELMAKGEYVTNFNDFAKGEPGKWYVYHVGRVACDALPKRGNVSDLAKMVLHLRVHDRSCISEHYVQLEDMDWLEKKDRTALKEVSITYHLIRVEMSQEPFILDTGEPSDIMRVYRARFYDSKTGGRVTQVQDEVASHERLCRGYTNRARALGKIEHEWAHFVDDEVKEELGYVHSRLRRKAKGA